MPDRQDLLDELELSLKNFKVTGLLGPRGCGKSSLVGRMDVPEGNRFDLEDPMDQARLENAEEVLGGLRGLVLIDGIQRQPELFPTLLGLATSWGGPSQFLVVGSVSPHLMKGVAEVATAKVNFIEMGGLSCREVGEEMGGRLWLRGGLPESYFAETDEDSALMRDALVQTFLRRDLSSIGIDVPPERLWRFWMEAAARHGEAWNSSAVASALGVSHPTARSYLSLLTEAFMLRQLRPFVAEGTKRRVKAPKVYVRDSGLLHGLLELRAMEDLEASSSRLASWRGFMLEQLVSVLRLEADELFFWATHGGAGIDLVVERDGKGYGFEFKLTEKPRVTHSMTIAKADLDLERIYLVYPGDRSFLLREGMEALGSGNIPEFELP